MTGQTLRFAILGFMITGCTSKPAPKAPAVPTAPETSPAAPPASAQPTAPPASPNVAVSSTLAKDCKLRFASSTDAPKFDFDQFQLLAEDRDVLEQVADCLTRGPLHGQGVRLIGRADPRGTDEYNLGLGTRRAETVSSYLQRLGVPAQQLSQTTRGNLDAAGRDESGWRMDRRVDLQLRD